MVFHRWILIVSLNYFVTRSLASKLSFNSTGSFIPKLSDNLTLTCVIDKNVISTQQTIVGRRALNHTDENVYPAAVRIVKDDSTLIASVTHYAKATGMRNESNLYVSGQLDGNPVTSGYLTVGWRNPSASEEGKYSCEVNAITGDGHVIVLSETLQVTIATPTIQDLIDHIHTTEVKVRNLEEENRRLRDEMSHVESGFIYCGSSSNYEWTTIDNGESEIVRSVNKTVMFTSPYAKIPVVHLSVQRLNFYFHDVNQTNQDYSIYLEEVNNHGFNMACDVFATSGYTDDFDVSWISVPN